MWQCAAETVNGVMRVSRKHILALFGALFALCALTGTMCAHRHCKAGEGLLGLIWGRKTVRDSESSDLFDALGD